MDALGRHIIVDYFDCDPEVLMDVVHIEKSMNEAAVRAGATIISSAFHHFSPFGVSGVIVIQESHISIHTWPEYGFASVDIFTCGDSVDPWIAYRYLKDTLKAAHGSAVEMNRGHEKLLPKTDVELEKFRSGKFAGNRRVRSRRDIWFTERDENLALSLRHEGEKLFNVKSDHQKVEVYRTKAYGNILVLDGKIMCTEEDEYVYHEMITHVPLLTHPAPENVLVIGGGDGGTVREVVKHPEVKNVTLVEIDEYVLEASRKHLPTLSSALEHPKLQINICNGTEFVKKSPEQAYDIVIVDSNDPIGPAEGLFKESFYRNVHRILKNDGIMITQSESPRFNKNVFREIYHRYYTIFGKESVFCYLTYIPSFPTGMWSFSYSTKGRCHPVNTIEENRQQSLVKSNNLKYYNATIHKASFALPVFVEDLLI